MKNKWLCNYEAFFLPTNLEKNIIIIFAHRLYFFFNMFYKPMFIKHIFYKQKSYVL